MIQSQCFRSLLSTGSRAQTGLDLLLSACGRGGGGGGGKRGHYHLITASADYTVLDTV